MKELIKYLYNWNTITSAHYLDTLTPENEKYYNRVRNCLQRLTDEEREIIYYMIINHHTVKDTFDERGCLATNYRKRNRALAKLYFMIEGRYNDKL